MASPGFEPESPGPKPGSITKLTYEAKSNLPDSNRGKLGIRGMNDFYSSLPGKTRYSSCYLISYYHSPLQPSA